MVVLWDIAPNVDDGVMQGHASSIFGVTGLDTIGYCGDLLEEEVGQLYRKILKDCGHLEPWATWG